MNQETFEKVANMKTKNWDQKSDPLGDIARFKKECDKAHNEACPRKLIAVSPEIYKIIMEKDHREVSQKVKTNQGLIIEYIIMRIDMLRRSLKHIKLKVVIFFYRLLRKLICFFYGHNASIIRRDNGITIHYCPRCKKVNPQLSLKDYNVRCLVGGKMRLLPLIKWNQYTVKVGIDNKVIDRHIDKHEVNLIINNVDDAKRAFRFRPEVTYA